MLTRPPKPGLRSPQGRAPPGRPRNRRLVSLAKALICIISCAILAPHAVSLVVPPRLLPEPHQLVAQYEAGGALWLESRHHELVHFVCRPGEPYRIGLDVRSMTRAGISPAEHRRYLGALHAAVADWAELMGCHRFQVEMDLSFPDTRITFEPIPTIGTLAHATRAGDIKVNALRAWFPGGRQYGHYGRNRSVSFYWVVAHELGHVWGLAHSDDPRSLMYPTQCHTCRWSSFEQAAGNVIRAASSDGRWSRPHYANRYFAKTPLSAVESLLKGDIPDADEEVLAAARDCDREACQSLPREENERFCGDDPLRCDAAALPAVAGSHSLPLAVTPREVPFRDRVDPVREVRKRPASPADPLRLPQRPLPRLALLIPPPPLRGDRELSRLFLT